MISGYSYGGQRAPTTTGGYLPTSSFDARPATDPYHGTSYSGQQAAAQPMSAPPVGAPPAQTDRLSIHPDPSQYSIPQLVQALRGGMYNGDYQGTNELNARRQQLMSSPGALRQYLSLMVHPDMNNGQGLIMPGYTPVGSAPPPPAQYRPTQVMPTNGGMPTGRPMGGYTSAFGHSAGYPAGFVPTGS